MGADGGFALYDISPATSPEIVTEAAQHVLAPVLDAWRGDVTRYSDHAEKRPDQRDYWRETVGKIGARIAALEAAIQAGDVLAILRECCDAPHISNWGACWWGPADKPPRVCRIVRLSTGDNIGDEMYHVNRFMWSLCGQGVVDQLKDEETWT